MYKQHLFDDKWNIASIIYFWRGKIKNKLIIFLIWLLGLE